MNEEIGRVISRKSTDCIEYIDALSVLIGDCVEAF